MQEHERTGLVDQVTWRFSQIAMYIPLLIVGIMFYEVVLRYIFFSPTLWVNEASLWLGGMVYLFSGIYVMQQRGHIRFTILYDIAPRWIRKTFDLLALMGLILFCGCMIWGNFDEAWTKLMRWERFGTAWNPPIPATMKPIVLLTLFTIAVQGVSNLIMDWRRPEGQAYLEKEEVVNIEEIKRAQKLT